jgi:hypothetical protein
MPEFFNFDPCRDKMASSTAGENFAFAKALVGESGATSERRFAAVAPSPA